MTHTEARELANQFGSRMCDENGETHNQELYCFDLDDIIAIKEAMAQPEQEPVAFASHGVINWIADKQFQHEADLYITPLQRKPLTDEAITKVIDSMPRGINGWMSDWDLYEFARAIEAKLKEKNT